MATANDAKERAKIAARAQKYLDSKAEALKAGILSRKVLIAAMVGKGIPEGAANTQATKWARANGVTYARPSAVEGNKKALRDAKRAAGKVVPIAAGKNKPAKPAKAPAKAPAKRKKMEATPQPEAAAA